MSQSEQHRLRIKLPSGAEFEAEGTPDFVDRERKEFLDSLQEARRQGPGSEPSIPEAPQIAWDALAELKGRDLQLRAKLGSDKSEKDACLVLLAASQKVLKEPKPTATQLAKWLRRSGYPILRMDRALRQAVEQGEILASGSRRSRRYELTAPGRLRAFILASQLSTTITGKA